MADAKTPRPTKTVYIAPDRAMLRRAERGTAGASLYRKVVAWQTGAVLVAFTSAPVSGGFVGDLAAEVTRPCSADDAEALKLAGRELAAIAGAKVSFGLYVPA
jgi:hypothetical protein